ncbi:hypothetical protein ACEW7V_00600 [Areca yellow leaf disease phytoplasma]|uniref:hypothetical protein n=1 Tax=Areca yellow leaf disease phytoplasma TaxID=927614 RepID=UPI0035B55293
MKKEKHQSPQLQKEYLLTTINDALEKLTDKFKTGQRTMEYLLDDDNYQYKSFTKPKGQSDIKLKT